MQRAIPQFQTDTDIQTQPQHSFQSHTHAFTRVYSRVIGSFSLASGA